MRGTQGAVAASPEAAAAVIVAEAVAAPGYHQRSQRGRDTAGSARRFRSRRERPAVRAKLVPRRSDARSSCRQQSGTGWRCLGPWCSQNSPRDDDLPFATPGFDVRESLWRLRERVGLLDDRAEGACLEEFGDLVELGSAGAHEEERVPDAQPAGRASCLEAQQRHGPAQGRFESMLAHWSREGVVGLKPLPAPDGHRPARSLSVPGSLSRPCLSSARG
jgi:hypothetical protein